MTTFYPMLMGSLGVCTGLLVFMIAKHGLDWALGHQNIRKDIERTNEKSLELLDRRNELTSDTNGHLKRRNALALETIGAQLRIAEAIEGLKPPGGVTTSDMWEEFLTHHTAGPPACGLCGNSGQIEIEGLRTPGGFAVEPISQPCICPNGRALT